MQELPMRPRLSRIALVLAMGMTLQACSLAPTYHTPQVALPQHYREQTQDGPWKIAQPGDKLQTQWWQLYHDSHLDELQSQLLKANPDLAAALAHYDGAQAFASQLHSGLFPQINASAQPMRQRQSDTRPLRGSDQPAVYNSNTLGLSLNFDLDLWGKIRNQVAAGDAQAQASADSGAPRRGRHPRPGPGHHRLRPECGSCPTGRDRSSGSGPGYCCCTPPVDRSRAKAGYPTGAGASVVRWR